MAVVELEAICKTYGGVANLMAVDHVSLTVRHGEFMVLLGPSGCGKSTTLRMVAGLESISSGTLSIDGKVVNQVPAKDRDIAMVFQSYALYPHMSVADNLAFGLRRRSIAKDEIVRRVTETAEILGLTSLMARKPQALSGGQRQRVALGRAMVREPQVFLFDEPLSNLDAALRVNTRNELIKQHHRLGSTMIYVTHDQVEAMTMGTRICVMNGGRIAQTGAPLEVYWEPADTFVARFLGSPPMNLITVPLTRGPAGFRVETLTLTAPLPHFDATTLAPYANRDIVFGVRAEDIHIDTKALPEGPYGSIYGEVYTVEPRGAETLIGLVTEGGAEWTARLPRAAAAKLGERLKLFFPAKAGYLFDAASTKAIGRMSS
jgi:multiple sugar transport system ATP-binding protein